MTLNGPVPETFGGGEGVTVLHDLGLVLARLGLAAIELGVHREDVGDGLQHQRERLGGDEIHGEIIHLLGFGDGVEDRLEVRGGLQTVDGPYHVIGGEVVAGVELHTLAQVETDGLVVDALILLGQTRLELQILGVTHQGVEHQVRHLQGLTGELLLRVQRGGVGRDGDLDVGSRNVERETSGEQRHGDLG